MRNITFTMIKPEAVEAGNTGAILNRMEEAGFRISALKKVHLTAERAGLFYEVHKERPFFRDLVEYMTSQPVVVQVLTGENAIEKYRSIMGATNPEDAEEGTIRKLFAINVQENSVHGSDSAENAQIEINFFFNSEEIVGQFNR